MGIKAFAKISIFTLSAAMTLADSRAWAAEEGDDNRLHFNEKTWALLGVTGSYNVLQSQLATESDKKGFGFGVKGVVSTYFDRFILDGAGGWNLSSVKGSSGVKTTQIDTQSGLLEGDLRYAFRERFSVGPALQLYFGTDQTYAEIVSTERNWALFGGLGAYLDIPTSSLLMRLGTKVVADLSVADRRVYVGFLDFQIGLPLFDGKPKPKRREEEKIEELPPVAFREAPPPVTEIPRAEVRNLGNRRMLVRLPSDQFLFDTGMSHLKSPSKHYLQELGSYLAQNPDNYTRIEVTGHTDRRGTRRVNQTLSTARAKTVRNILSDAGVAASKISYAGRAFDEPIDPRSTPMAWAKNRRTDLVFRGVVRPADIERKVEELNDRYGRGEFN